MSSVATAFQHLIQTISYSVTHGVSNHPKKLILGGVLVALVYYGSKRRKKENMGSELAVAGDGTVKGKKKRSRRNPEFGKQLVYLLRIVIPGFQSKEFMLLLLHTAFLVARTFVSIWVAKLDGSIVKSLVDRNGKQFVINMCWWLGVAVPATYINAMIKFLESKLAIAFRTRLVEHSYALYMKNETYYRVDNLDSRLTNADQCLTEDISRFCSFLAHLHSQLSKPVLDVALMSYELFSLAAAKTGTSSTLIPTVFGFGMTYLSGVLLRWMQPPFGKLVKEQAKLEGLLRFVHSRLISNAEEVAFYGGHYAELGILKRAYLNLVKHMNDIYKVRILYNTMEGFIMKYCWSAVGLSMIAIPSFFFDKERGQSDDETVSTRTQDYVTSRKLLVSAAEALERMMLAAKDINELAGYTSRVYEMLNVFKGVSQGEYVKTVNSQVAIDLTKRGKVIIADKIDFKDMPIVSPNGDILVRALNCTIEPGMHLLITGPNGCGKSSLFRILGGLWPVYSGSMTRPAPKDMFYIPQRPYLYLGSLRDQIIYPHSVDEMRAKGVNDDDLMAILDWVNLRYIVEREGGWNSEKNWKDVLSGGEKQRVGVARLFYHKPKYAILDECTSAVSIDVEGKMYQHAIDEGITLMTVTHRPSLWKFHKYLLQFDGQGSVQFTPMNNAEVRMSLKDEKSKLETQLGQIPQLEKRLVEVCEILNEESVVLNDWRAAHGDKDEPKEQEEEEQKEEQEEPECDA